MTWQRKPRVPKVGHDWPMAAVDVPIKKLIEMYDSGYRGCIYDPTARDELFSAQPYPDGELAASQFGLAESGAGKLSLPYKPAYDHWPECWPCPGQQTGDCVSHAGKNSGIVLIGAEVAAGVPDPVTNIVESWPEVTKEAEREGVVACENIYGDRGHGGQGASCSRLIRHVTEWGGILLRQNYPELGIDLTRYTVRLGINWGRSQTPENVRAEARKHQIRTATDCPNHEVCRDFIANGYPIWVCSGYGWSSSRDENGYSVRRGSWSHSWVIMAYDDREATKQKYGFPLALYNHDWGKWNSGGRRILGTDIDIPEGSMWIDARLLDNCDCTAMSNFDGFPARKLPDWGFQTL